MLQADSPGKNRDAFGKTVIRMLPLNQGGNINITPQRDTTQRSPKGPVQPGDRIRQRDQHEFCIEEFAKDFFALPRCTVGIYDTLWNEYRTRDEPNHFISSIFGVYFNEKVTPSKLIFYKSMYPNRAQSLPPLADLQRMLFENEIIYMPSEAQKTKILEMLDTRIESHVTALIDRGEVKISRDSKHEHYHSKENLVKHLKDKAALWHRKDEGWGNLLCLAKAYSLFRDKKQE